MVALVAIAVAGGLFVWRESRIRRTGKLTKAQKTLAARMDRLEHELRSQPGEQALAEFEGKLREIEKATAGSTPIQLKVLVDRVNVVSQDATALKTEFIDLKNRFAKLENTSKWGEAMKRSASGG